MTELLLTGTLRFNSTCLLHLNKLSSLYVSFKQCVLILKVIRVKFWQLNSIIFNAPSP